MKTDVLQGTNLFKAQASGWLVVAFGFFGFLLWAATYVMNQGVPASGFVTTRTEKIGVVSPSSGLIKRLNVNIGDAVQAGDVLMELDDQNLVSTGNGTLENIKGIQSSNLTLKSALSAKNRQIEVLTEQLTAFEKLVESGFASVNSLTPTKTQISQAQSESLELLSRIEQNQARLKELNEHVSAIKHEKTLKKILAPVSGRVMNFTVKSAGVSVVAGAQILEIAPEETDLLVDARVPVDYATIVHTGLPVDIMFPTLPGSSTLRIKGELEYLSGERVVDQKTNQIYLEGRVKLLPDPQVEKLHIRTGVPAMVYINTGPRTMLSYIVRPFTERLAKGMQ